MQEKSANTVRNADDRVGANRAGRRIGLFEVIVAAVTYFAVQSIGGILTVSVLGIPPEELLTTGGSTATILLVATAAVSALAAALVASVIRVRSLSAIGLTGTTWRWLAIGAGAGLLAYLVNRVVVVLYVVISGDTSNPQQGLADTAMGGSFPAFLLLTVVGGLIVPLCEELLFRGVVFGWLRRWGFVMAAVVSSLVFGLAHGLNVVLPAAIILGLLNAYVYEKSGSIWPAAVAHAVNNTLVFVLARVLISTGVVD